MPRPIVAAIVPAYNEEKTVARVVATLRASPLISEIIVISDGSTDGTAAEARAAGATLVHELPIRAGKGKAVQHGVAHTDAPVLFLCDADLIGLTIQHIRTILDPVLYGEKGMSVGLRDRGRWMMRIQRHLPLIGGERALQRSLFERIPDRYLQGFMLEAALNFACRSRGIAYGGVPLTGLTIRRKIAKFGLGRGLVEYLKMFREVAWAYMAVRLAARRGQF